MHSTNNAVCLYPWLQAVKNPESAGHQHLRRTGNPPRKVIKTPPKALPNIGELEIIGEPVLDTEVVQHEGNPEWTSTAGGNLADADLQNQLIPATESEASEPSAAPRSAKGGETEEQALDKERDSLGEARGARPRQWNRSFADVRRTHALSIAARYSLFVQDALLHLMSLELPEPLQADIRVLSCCESIYMTGKPSLAVSVAQHELTPSSPVKLPQSHQCWVLVLHRRVIE